VARPGGGGDDGAGGGAGGPPGADALAGGPQNAAGRLNAAGSAVSRRTDPGRRMPLRGARPGTIQMRITHIRSAGNTLAGAPGTPAVTVRDPQVDPTRCQPVS